MNTSIFLKSIWGGISIMIASYIYLNTGGICGAILFSIGLLIILNMNLSLFTGTVGYINSKKYFKTNAVTLIGNIIGCLSAMLFRNQAAQELVNQKIYLPYGTALIKSIVCGILIYAAVESFRRGKDYMVPLCVTGFIMFGAEHCIADLCYVLMSTKISFKTVIFLFIVSLGNGIGAILMHIGTVKV